MHKETELIIIAAVAANRVIGDTIKGLPWHIPEDFKHFKSTTLGYPVIVGERTHIELGRPLPGRLNIVLSFDNQYQGDNLRTARSIAEAVQIASDSGCEKAFIIGGRSVYNSALPYCHKMVLSHLPFEAEGDILFPDFSEKEWLVESTEQKQGFYVAWYTHVHGRLDFSVKEVNG
ncbi:MAG: dihydrofolate reductase [Ignavibacteria bacterium]|nr:dihydrofolate reductase [Ignavibacteria bacterium]